MFNNVVNRTTSTPPQWNRFMGGRINVSDKIVQTPIFFEFIIDSITYYFLNFPYFLYKLESQFTKKTKIFSRGTALPLISANVNSFDRSLNLTWPYNTPGEAVEDLSTGKIIVGSKDFPLGFYNLTIYEMETSNDLDPSNAKSTVYNGLVNMYPDNLSYGTNTANFQEVNYDDYSNNDADTDNVYITY